MVKLAAFLRSPFSFLFADTRTEDRVAVYVTREHHRGRALEDILHDPYVRSRLSERASAGLLERPDLVQAIVADDVYAAAAVRMSRFTRTGRSSDTATRHDRSAASAASRASDS